MITEKQIAAVEWAKNCIKRHMRGKGEIDHLKELVEMAEKYSPRIDAGFDHQIQEYYQ